MTSKEARLGRFILVVGVLMLAAPTMGDGPFQFHTLTPCRLADTRNAVGPQGGPILTSTVVREFPVQGVCGVPVGARAVTVNVTAVAPVQAGFLTLFPTGITRPVVSSINFAAGDPALGNGAIVPLGDYGSFPDEDLSVYAFVLGGGTVHMVLDVTGYFQ